MASAFAEVELGPPIEIFAVNKACADDTHPKKVNLSIGAYKTEEGQPWVLPVVRETEIKLAEDKSLNHEYLPILGLQSFCDASVRLLLGADNVAIKDGRAFGVQTLSGTGALRVGAEFLAKVLKSSVFYYSNPTWENHRLIFLNAGFTDARQYRYWDASNRCLDLEGMLQDLRNAPLHACVILHSCAHNPTGCDPTQDQWKIIADVCRERKLFVFFDTAYQGFATGNPDQDAWAPRYFVSQGFEIFAAQSYAKNFGLYNERVGNLSVITKNNSVVPQVKSQLTLIVRGMYSNPPSHGAKIVSTILNDKALTEKWLDCVTTMATRIKDMRVLLKNQLTALNVPGNWDHITTQIGMFSFTGLNKWQVGTMTEKHHVYLPSNGRINMCAINPSNVQHVAAAILDTVTNCSEIEKDCSKI